MVPPTTTAGPLRNKVPAILLTGLVAGLLDITAACIQAYIKYGIGPDRVLRYVARGVFGKEAATGGIVMAAWGLLFHFMIAYGLTIFYFWLYPKIGWLGKNKIIAGLLYGILAWLVTNLVIVPLSAIGGPGHIVFAKIIVPVLILMFCIGLPISLMANKHYLYKK